MTWKVVKFILILMFVGFLAFVFLNNKQEKAVFASIKESPHANQQELEKIIAYYESLPFLSKRREALLFLLKNMPQHYSYVSDSIDAFDPYLEFIGAQSYDQRPWAWDSLNKSGVEINTADLRMEPDLQNLDADLIISNIEHAFKVWEKTPWKNDYSFEQFCEYVLPYKCSTENTGYWRDTLYHKNKWIYDSLGADYSVEDVYTILYNTVYDSFKITTDSYYPVNMSLSKLMKVKSGSCPDKCNYTAYTLRAMGVPVAIETIPAWANADMAHSWNVFIAPNGDHKFIIKKEDKPFKYPFFHAGRRKYNGKFIAMPSDLNNPRMKTFLEQDVLEYKMINTDHISENITVYGGLEAPKVFRRTYSINAESQSFIHNNKNNSPPFFNNSFLKDITDRYIPVHDVSLKVNKRPSAARYVYLCTPEKGTFRAVMWGRLKNDNTVGFKKMGGDVLYFPMYYVNNQFVPAADPFILMDSGEIKRVVPDFTKQQTLVLQRKFPLFSWHVFFANKLIGGSFEVSNTPNFEKARKIHTIEKTPKLNVNQIEINETGEYRYVRFLHNDSPADFNEMKFYTEEDGKYIELTGEVIMSRTDIEPYARRAFDDNLYTRYEEKQKTDWIGLDLKTKQKIDRIMFCPRNDMNGIEKGHDYELLVWNDKWISLGEKTATNYDNVVFEHAPSNAIFWLRNLTAGKQERIFTYKSGQQFW